MVQQAVSPRPGRTYFTPGVRISKLQHDLKPGDDPGEELLLVEPDILSVEVTRVHTGASQYSITLNNWYVSLPGERRNDTAAPGDKFAALRTEFVGEEQLDNDRPVWPRYKYNDFRHLQFGDRLRIDMRVLARPAGRRRGRDEGLPELDPHGRRPDHRHELLLLARRGGQGDDLR